MKKLTALLLALVFACVALVSCAQESEPGRALAFDSVEILYNGQSAELDGLETVKEQYKESMGNTTISFTDQKITLEKDGKSQSYAYTIDGNTVKSQAFDTFGEGATVTLKEDGTLIIAFSKTEGGQNLTVNMIFK